MESLERLQGLHADLVAFTETRLANIDRLWEELQASLEEFRSLLDKSTPTQSDRDAYNSGKITVGEQEYGINDDFKHMSRALGTVLELDEIEAGKLLVQDYGKDISADQSFVSKAVGNFHDRRDLLLQNLRIVLQESLNLDHDESLRTYFQDVVAQVLNIKSGPPSNGSQYLAKCLKAMQDIEEWQVKITDGLQSKPTLGEVRGTEFYSTLEFQRDSLFKQHEALGCVIAYLFRGNYTISEDLRKLYQIIPRWKMIDFQLVHYLPAFAAGFNQYGSPEGSVSADDAKSLNRVFGTLKQDGPMPMTRSFSAALALLWTAEFSGWFRDTPDSDDGAETRSSLAKEALSENALELLLSVCSTISFDAWRHPARQEMVALMLSDISAPTLDGEQTSSYFRLMIMECIESFTESWITNMPDTIRRLKNEEDDQRLLFITALQDGIGPTAPRESAGRLHLESFLVLISFAFENRPAASEIWWDDPDSNLYGFLQWASKRQTVPRVSAFCEMLISISDGPDGAAAAHKFLLDDSVPASSARSRRIPSMNYQQMFAELDLYAHKVHERPATTQLAGARTISPTEMNELESPLMLSCYLRLISHLCRETIEARDYVFGNTTVDLPRSLLLLSSGPVPTYLRASIFTALDALLTNKNSQRAYTMWKTLDQWASNGQEILNAVLNKTNQPSVPTLVALQNTLRSISISFDQYDAFVMLLRNLMTMAPGPDPDNNLLPFPTDLGSGYRIPGISPYVDFVCGRIFVKRTRELSDETQALLSSFHCLDLIAAGLEDFNESFVAMLDRTPPQGDMTQTSATVTTYAQRHPFARLMYWVLGTDLNRALLKATDASLTDVENAGSESPLVLNVQRSIDIINLVLELQPTYDDLVKPLIKDFPQDRSAVGFSSIEDAIVAHPDLIIHLCQFGASEHLPLALRSLALLNKLSSSPRLNNHFMKSDVPSGKTRRIIDMLGPNAVIELKPVSKTLASRLQLDVRELEDGYESSGYLTKDGITAFLNACLKTQPELPNLAHLLLGFNRMGEQLITTSSLEDGTAVFSAIIDLVQNYPDCEGFSYMSWLVHIKTASIQVLRQLWSSPLSSTIVFGQLRRYHFLQNQIAGQNIVSQNTIWDGNVLTNPAFWYTTGAEALAEFLHFRGALYQYACQEIRAASTDKLTTVLRSNLSTLLGKSSDRDDIPASHMTIFDLGDFMDLDLTAAMDIPTLQYFGDLDFEVYQTESTDDSPSIYDLPVLRESLHVYQTQLQQQYAQANPSKQLDEEDIMLEIDDILGCFEARNRWIQASKMRREALCHYVDMVIAVIECCQMDAVAKMQFILHMLQLILPKLDAFVIDESEDTIELARAADALLYALSQTTENRGRMESVITEKIFQLFRTCIEGIPMPNSSILLRTTLYSVCAQYLTRIVATTGAEHDPNRKGRSHSMDCVRSAGLRLINTLSDDADDGVDSCRLNALILLGLLASLSRGEKSPYIVDSLAKGNLLEILLEPLKHITNDFQDTEPAHRQYILSVFEARMLFLLQISRTREGSRAILDAGFIPAVRDSMLFRADPDLGISNATETSSSTTSAPIAAALHNYYTLLSSTLRVLLSVFLSRGPQNEQAQFLARSFLQDYRPNMVGLFKKYAGVNGKVEERSRAVLADCVRSYTGLVSLSGFVDFEDQSMIDEMRGSGFT